MWYNSLQKINKDFLIMEKSMIDKLLTLKDGDAALLYMFILSHSTFNENEAKSQLDFSSERMERAIYTINNISLAKSPVKEEKDKVVKAVYTMTDIRIKREEDVKFSAVCDCAELVLAKTLGESDLKMLINVYSELKLPAEVIIEVMSYLKSTGKKITRAQLNRELYLCADAGIFTYDRADEYIKNRSLLTSYVAACFRLFGFEDRDSTPKEDVYLRKYLNYGFPAESVAMAYSRMLLNTGKFSWSYLDKILEVWHEKNLHTASEINVNDPVGKTVAEKNYQAQNSFDTASDPWLSKLNEVLNSEGK